MALLLHHPETKVTAIDLSPAQASLILEKSEAIKNLNHQDFMNLFWGPQQPLGRLEKYFLKFRTQVLPLLWSDRDLREMCTTTNLEKQLALFSSANPALLKERASQFFAQGSLSAEGRDSSQFAYVEQTDIGSIFLRNFVTRIRSHLISQNPYMYFFLTGEPLLGAFGHPLWKKESYDIIRSRIHNLQVVVQDLESYIPTSKTKYSFMNLSDIFEYLSPVQSDHLFSELSSVLKPDGILAYWTLLVPRISTDKRLLPIQDLTNEFTAKDRTWFYSGFHALKRI